MSCVRFTRDGYDYIDSDNVIRFVEDKQHSLLFDYVSNICLSQLPKLLEQYVIKKMDITTFELNGYRYGNKDSEAICKILTDLHPYYRYNLKAVFVKMVGNYLNALLLKSSCQEGQKPIIYTIYNHDWYIKRFKALADDYLRFDDDSPNAFYDKYKYYVGDVEDEGGFIFLPKHILNRPANECIDELWTQEAVARMLYWILDISADNIKDLTMSQRVWLYANLFGTLSERSHIDVTKHLSLTAPVRYNAGQDHTPQWEYLNEKEDLFSPLYNKLGSYHTNPSDIKSETSAALNKAIKRACEIHDNEIHEEYMISNLYQLLFLEISKMIDANTIIRKCRHCGRYFVVENLNMRYCSRVTDGEDQPCNIIGSKNTFDEKLKTDPALKLYSKAYKTHYARINRDTFTKVNFSKWKEKAKVMLGEVRTGKLDISDFEMWLKK